MLFRDQWMDITGNWYGEEGFQKGLIASEAEPVGEGNRFRQKLRLPAGRYQLMLAYDANRDHAPGKALFYGNDLTITIGGRAYAAHFRPDSNGTTSQARIEFDVAEGGVLEVETRVLDTRMPDTYLRCDQEMPLSRFAAVNGRGDETVSIVRGIPFLAPAFSERLSMWNGSRYLKKPEPVGGLVNWKEVTALRTGGAKVRRAFFLGMTHCYDVANGSWYSPKGDHGFSHFVGDNAGTLRLGFSDGSTEDVPLVFGFNVWYGNPWDLMWDQSCFPPEGQDIRVLNPTIFGGNEAYRETVRTGVGLDDGVRRMGAKHNQRYLFALDLDGRELRSVEICRDEMLYGIVIVSGITLEIEGEPGEGLTRLPDLAPVSTEITLWTLDEIRERAYEPALERIRRVLYTHTDELPVLAKPDIPEGYLGPRYDFRGRNEALLAATFLYWNGPECAAHIGDGGMNCSSQTARWRTSAYMSGMGVWMRAFPVYDGLTDFLRCYASRNAGEFPPLNAAWTRGIGELMREAMALGYDKCIDNYTNWLDAALFREADPPHWNRIESNHGEGYHTSLVGDIEERGNRENDGHGICMWGRYMIWLWKGRDPVWNRAHFDATRAAVEWIQWQLDTDTLRPGRRIDILYTESECAHGDYDFYSSFNCLRGVGLSMRMAAQLGEMELYARWNALYERLARGIYEHLRDESAFGAIWHTEEACDWQDHAHKLAHLLCAPDGDTYAPLEDYSRGWDKLFLETDVASYRYLMKDGIYDCLRMYGYGQGMMLQASLLLDEMASAEKFLNLLVTHNYLPKLEKWICPEGIITHRSGKFYVPVNGYMGQDSHLADSLKAVRLLLGVDDNREDRLRLLPRFPMSWTSCEIGDYPVLTGGTRGKMRYAIERSETELRMQIELPAESTLDVRVGPLPVGAAIENASVNGENIAFESYLSGDSRWVWLRDLHGTRFDLCISHSKTGY